MLELLALIAFVAVLMAVLVVEGIIIIGLLRSSRAPRQHTIYDEPYSRLDRLDGLDTRHGDAT